jgi:glycine/D-amino acid oxidase-like deaminating enzyme
VHGLAAAACRAGARLASAIPVQRVKGTVGNWTVETSRGVVRATDVLFATNGYTDRSAPALRRRLVPIGSYIIATEPLSDTEAVAVLPTRRVVFDSKYFLYYFRLSADNRLLFPPRR